MDLAACHVSPARSLAEPRDRRGKMHGHGGWVCLRADDGIKRINTLGGMFHRECSNIREELGGLMITGCLHKEREREGKSWAG